MRFFLCFFFGVLVMNLLTLCSGSIEAFVVGGRVWGWFAVGRFSMVGARVKVDGERMARRCARE